jgi:hypothetical protein
MVKLEGCGRKQLCPVLLYIKRVRKNRKNYLLQLTYRIMDLHLTQDVEV